MSRGRHEQGSAMVEYTVIVGAVIAPLVYLVVLMAEIQAAAFASTAAAREAGRVTVAGYAQGQPVPEASGQAAAELVLQDFGVEASALEILCAGCDQETGVVTSTASVDVDLPGLHRLDITGPRVLTLTAEHTEPLDRHRELR